MSRLHLPGGLQARLMAAFVAVTLVALALSSTVFVFLRRDDQERRALDRVAATSPAVSEDLASNLAGRNPDLDAIVEAASERFGVRVLLVDPLTGLVAADSEGSLAGELVQPPAIPPGRPPGGRPYESWSPPRGNPAAGFTYVTALLSDERGRGGPGRGQPPAQTISSYQLVLGVPESTLSGAWLDLLPWVGTAGGAALAVAVLLAVLLARSIARPVERLTFASQQVAAGHFDVTLDTARGDELGRLGAAFSSMASRIGETQSEMRSLIADVSHDLKTPLTSILGFARALESGAAASPEEAQRFGRIILEEAQRLAGRLESLLLLSELDSGQAVLQPTAVDCADLVAAVADRVLRDAAERGIAVEHHLAAGVIVEADPVKLERTVENLLANAAKFTPPGGVISLAVGAVRADGMAAAITIANTAPDIEASELPLLFRRFYRRDRTRAAGAGSGLGLPIARDLVTLHGGRVDGVIEDGRLVLTVLLPARPPAS